MAAGDAARAYHLLSSFDRARWDNERDWLIQADDPRVLQGFDMNVVANFPAHFKAYAPGLPTIDLPRTWAPGRGSTTSILAGRSAGPSIPFDLVMRPTF